MGTERQSTKLYMDMVHRYSANHYKRLPVTIEHSADCSLWDIDGRCYLDMFADYSAVNFGYRHPSLVKALLNQVNKLPLCSGAVYNSVYAEFCEALAAFSGIPEAKVLVMNTGAEAVEKAIKIARKWGYRRKGVKNNQAEVIFTDTNFHGRTLGVLSASRVYEYRAGFGPFLPGVVWTKFGDIQALEQSINCNTVAFLLEPIQGEGGFIFPPEDYFKKVAETCKQHNILLVLDEIPTAFGRTGYDLSHEHDGITPDMVILGKALGGGLLPLSAVVTRSEIMDVLGPGDDGSTFGGNPLACAVGLEVIRLLRGPFWVDQAEAIGWYLMNELDEIKNPLIKEVRGRGLFIGVELVPEVDAHEVCVQLLNYGVLTNNARQNVVRFTPPLSIDRKKVNQAVDAFDRVLRFFWETLSPVRT